MLNDLYLASPYKFLTNISHFFCYVEQNKKIQYKSPYLLSTMKGLKAISEELLNLVENLFLFDRFLFFSIFVQNK